MYPRLLTLNPNRSVFLFGARNTGKSTLINQSFAHKTTATFDLLDFDLESRFSSHPSEFYSTVMALPSTTTHVVIDEIQKVPQLLDVVHRLMGVTDKCFVMSGSSARKLKQGGANLLAGRAFVHHLFPLSFMECGDDFQLDHALAFGTLPEIFKMTSDQECRQFLDAYANTYLKEEIWAEHLIRKLDPFRRFLEVAAQSNGHIVNFLNIARDTGSTDKSVASYYQLLEDTLVGFFLNPHQHSFRKRLSATPKFYFFDPGVVRALTHLTDTPLKPGTSAYGNAFEHFIILECMRLGSYLKPNYTFSYLRTKDDAEIDLIIERPNLSTLLIEIKSSTQVEERMLSPLVRLAKGFENAKVLCLSQDPYAKQFEHALVLPWRVGLEQIFKGEIV